MSDNVKKLGIYIHIPFCASRCIYCDFYSKSGCDDMMPLYEKALITHIKEAAPQLDGYLIDTVYFGGGTPSYFGAERLVNVFNALKKHGNVLIDSEVTAEVNPDSISAHDLVLMKRAGFNRISIGTQSANDKILKNLGRRHDFAQAELAVENARNAGFDNISMDLIYGIPDQTRADWADTLVRTAALKPEHLSCYGLKIEEGTPLYIYKDSPFIPDDDTQADMYLYTIEALQRFGYRQYEISNFAMRGYASGHNMKYWSGGEYFGIGAAAHSYMGGARFSFISDIEGYITAVNEGTSLVDSHEDISEFERAVEYIMLGLRTVHGISGAEYYGIFRSDFSPCESMLEEFAKNGWAQKNEERWRLTENGFLISNTLINKLLDVHSEQRLKLGRPWIKPESDNQNQYSIFEEQKREEIRLFNGIT